MSHKKIVEHYIKCFKLLSQTHVNTYKICPFKDRCSGHGSCMVKSSGYACLDESDQTDLIARLIEDGYEKYRKEENQNAVVKES